MADTINRITLPPLGMFPIETALGNAMVGEMPCMTVLTVAHDGGPTSLAIVLYEPERGIGTATQLDADSARSLAAQLLELAGEIDPNHRKH